jgi:type 1 glutamine amidotransferase
MDYAKRCIDFAEAIGTTIVTFHMGFLPRDPKDPVYGEMLEALGSLAAYAAPKGVTLSLETGQETGEELVRFLDAITVARVGVNFDTANLVLYGLDDPPRALERLRGRVTSLHVKDGLPPDDPRLLGREVPLGEGRARVRECLRLLEAAGFQGPLIIENYVWRERGTDPLEELARARDFILGHDRPDARAAEPGPDALRVLVVTGGHDYPTSFYTVFEGRPEWVWSHAPSSEEAFAKEIVSRYDVLVLYDFSQQLGEEGKAHLKAFAEAAKGIVVLHHAICDYQDWPWFEELVGGRYLESDQGGWKASTYRHDVELFVRPVGSHPIVNPVGPLRLVDETYKGMRISPKVTPILEIDHPDGDRYVGWVSPYERSRVVYLQLGHDERAHRSQAYRDLVRNAILWSAGR